MALEVVALGAERFVPAMRTTRSRGKVMCGEWHSYSTEYFGTCCILPLEFANVEELIPRGHAIRVQYNVSAQSFSFIQHVPFRRVPLVLYVVDSSRNSHLLQAQGDTHKVLYTSDGICKVLYSCDGITCIERMRLLLNYDVLQYQKE